jgi:glucose/arabinose dehydrogenase
MRSTIAVTAALLVAAVLPTGATAADHTITTPTQAFVPGEVVIAQGDGLVHVSTDVLAPHDVTSVAYRPDGERLFVGDTISAGENTRVEGVEDLAPGAYDFFCTVHPTTMTGTLTVEAPPAEVPRVLLAPLPGAFELPVAMAQHPDSDDLYIVEKTGKIHALRDGLVYDPVPVLDVSDEVSSDLEQGLLGLAFSPDGEFAYVDLTDADGTTRVLEFAFADGALDPDSRRELLSVEQPFANHNGGSLVFGPDGFMYMSLGDGGSGGDPGYNGQRPQTLLGSLLRIDPRPSEDAPYTIPEDNPFVPDPDDPDKVIPEGAREEIWAYGLRNPWKFSFDRGTGDLWIADVGQTMWEEVDLQRAGSSGGQNYGWNHMEGLELYSGAPDGAEEPDDHTPPIHVYPHEDGACSITGGYVYRGEAIGFLQGAYVYSDWCDGRLRYIREENGEVVQDAELGVTVPSITAFGEDHDGELYAISLGGTVFRILPALP